MGRTIAIALAVVALLFGGGYWVQQSLFGPTEAGVVVPGATDSGSRKPPTQPAAKHETRVVEVSGGVERRASGSEQWLPVARGAVLHNNDSLRTAKGASAVLELGGARVEVDESSQFAIDEISSTLSSVRLEGGRIGARVKGGGESGLRVEVAGSDAVAETSDGEFAVLRTKDAHVTVATQSGSVDLQAQGQRVRVNAGEQSVVQSGAAPTKPERIPPSLFLKIASAGSRTLRQRETTIEGSTTPGAAVTINGEQFSADAQGRFGARVQLAEGRNSVLVAVEDALGRQQQSTLDPILVDTRPPKVSGEVVW